MVHQVRGAGVSGLQRCAVYMSELVLVALGGCKARARDLTVLPISRHFLVICLRHPVTSSETPWCGMRYCDLFKCGGDAPFHDASRGTTYLRRYAGWGAGQLANEVKRGVWFVAAASPSLVLSKAHTGADLWHTVMQHCGGDFAKLSAQLKEEQVGGARLGGSSIDRCMRCTLGGFK